MKVSVRIAAVYFAAALVMGAGVSWIVLYNQHNASHEVELTVGLTLVVTLIGISGIFLHYQQSLARAKRNLDEAQRLAGIGSWERDLISGRGYWSDNHYRLFGLQPRHTAPSMEEFLALIHEQDRPGVAETVADAIQACRDYEVVYRLAGVPDRRVFRSRGTVLTDQAGHPEKIIGSVQDITEKHLQERLREQLLEQKELLINRLSHDLKTPLTPLLALLPLIRNLSGDDRQRKLIDICQGSADNIRELVEKTIKLARLSSRSQPSIVLSDIPLAGAADDAVFQQAEVIRKNGTVIENRIAPGLMARAARLDLEEVFHHLIRNAVLYSPPNSRVILDAIRENEQVTVCVRDNGIGLSPEELHEIFDEFFKADQSRHDLGTSGLGLAICRRVIEGHGGRIWAESSGRGQGTTIRFTLPAGGAA